MKYKVFTFLLIAGSFCIINAQETNPQVSMMRGALSQFDEMKPSQKTPYINENTPEFVPLSEQLDQGIFTETLKDPAALFRLEEFSGGYTEIDGKEYPTVSIKLVYSFYTLPGYQHLNAWFEVKSVKNDSGKEMMLKGKILEKFMEYGIIDEGFNFPVPGEFSEKLWLNEEPRYQDKLTISGKLFIEFPDAYELAVLSDKDIGKAHQLNSLEYSLVEIDGNIATLRVQGDRRKMDGVKIYLLNEKNQAYESMQSIGINAKMYDFSGKKVKDPSDDEILNYLENFNYSDFNEDQVKKIEVNGPVSKLVLIRINSTTPLEQEFAVDLSVDF